MSLAYWRSRTSKSKSFKERNSKVVNLSLKFLSFNLKTGFLDSHILPSRACSSNLQWKESSNSCCEELCQSALVSKSLWAFIGKSERQNVCWKQRSQDKSTWNSSHSRNEILSSTFNELFENWQKIAFRFVQCNQAFNVVTVFTRISAGTHI